jgi:hypothetical protein
MEQSSAGDDLGLGTILMNQLGDMMQEILDRYPGTRVEPRVEVGMLTFEPGLTAPFLHWLIVSADGHEWTTPKTGYARVIGSGAHGGTL